MNKGEAAILTELEWLRRFASTLAQPGDQDDLVQATLLSAWRRPPRAEAEPGAEPGAEQRSLRPWLATVARNQARMVARGRQRRERREREADPATAGPELDAELDRVRVLRSVLDALDRLPELDRKIIMRRFFHEENATQIGDKLGIPAATVRSRLRRSLAQLRSSLDERHDGRRDAWALVLIGPAAAPVTATGAINMSITTKIILTIAGISTASAGLWWVLAHADEPELEPEPEPEPVITPSAVAPEPLDDSPRGQWEQRRSQIRSSLASKPEHDSRERTAGPLADQQLRADAWRGFHLLARACMDDVGASASGAISLSARIIGDPEVGTIFESVEVVAETVDDAEVLECLTESMYAYVGAKPPTAIEVDFAPTMQWVGQRDDETDDEEQLRTQQRMFDAIIGAHYAEVAFCDRKSGADNLGSLEIVLTIGPEQLAGQARVIASDLPKPVVDCIIAASLRWAFPAQLAGASFGYEFQLPVAGLEQVQPNRR
ncbi:RNA polymerase sigma-70 factor, ECF subfamily protein [Enhygromyxa salina]|uniref:RNA polymerase sigma-70 factor, ECF subfamily protein n=2 Tax=Enhygromyxa salina TaxID=215803 RepID=A0A0C2D864_9BACT|nr:RNA polymerase sigma-70 factor, ECF subfamily protein [Enhygromyxa salina]